jgi:hypothetical protein
MKQALAAIMARIARAARRAVDPRPIVTEAAPEHRPSPDFRRWSPIGTSATWRAIKTRAAFDLEAAIAAPVRTACNHTTGGMNVGAPQSTSMARARQSVPL